MKRLLEESKKRKKVLEENSQPEQMRKELEAPHMCNAVLEKSAVQEPQRDHQKDATLKDLTVYQPLVTSKVEQFLSQLDDSSSEESAEDDKIKKEIS